MARVVLRTRTRKQSKVNLKHQGEPQGESHSRVDEISKIAHRMSQIYPGYHPSRPDHVNKNAIGEESSNLVPSARRTCTLVVGFV